MSVHQFDSLPRYVRFLQENPQEVDLLYKELLIGVTNFFRDPGLFDFLRDKAAARLLQERPQGGPLRVWNPGCSTGEETYSLAMVLKECLEGLGLRDGPAIQVFATDIDKDAVEKARQGTFRPASPRTYRPSGCRGFLSARARATGSRRRSATWWSCAAEPAADPPFTKLDILCCRNLLIYLNVETQQKLLPLMHYALNPGGLLIRGTAESVGGFGQLFSPLDQKWKVFQRTEVSERPFVAMPALALHHECATLPVTEKAREPVMDIFYAAQRVLLIRTALQQAN